MRTSDSISKIAAALVIAQKAMTAAAKVATNPHFKSKYADLATVIEAVKAPLNEAGITVLQTVTNDTTGVMVTTTLLHESSEWIAETIYLPVPQQTPQAFGSAITYARRYSLQSFVTLPSEDDDGERASEPEKENAHRVEARRPNTATQVAVDALEDMSAADQQYLRDLAIEVIDMANNNDDAAGYIEAKRLSTEFKLGLWACLPSNVRSTIKRQQAAKMNKAPMLKPAPTPAELGSQA